MPRYPKDDVYKKKKAQQAKLKAAYGMEGSFKICVSGAAAGETTFTGAQKAYEVGRQIALQGAVLLTGATSGLPQSAAEGNYAHGGLCIGFSPAATPLAHVKAYKLPTECHDVIVYTGFDYAGRNLLLTRASDAVITIGGRMGTLNEFTIAFEDRKLVGVLADSGGIADEIPHLLHTAKKEIKAHVIYDTDPKRLVEKVIAELVLRNKAIRKKYA
ncbi:MAG: hypothetical protein AAB865_00225 [Patescibacteria group bacterium]